MTKTQYEYLKAYWNTHPEHKEKYQVRAYITPGYTNRTSASLERWMKKNGELAMHHFGWFDDCLALTPKGVEAFMAFEAKKTSSVAEEKVEESTVEEITSITEAPATEDKEDKEEKQTADQKFAEEIINQLQTNTAPWQRPWEVNEAFSVIPFNAINKKEYRGANVVKLMMRGFGDSRWMTFKQAKEKGWHVKKGEKGTQVSFFKAYLKDEETDEGEVAKIQHLAKKTYTVFNALQIDGVEPLVKSTNVNWDPVAIGEKILSASKAKISHDGGNRAYYNYMADTIHLPARAQFPTAAGYYSTALHELAHWTGNVGRCNRKIANSFGTEDYAKEELRAEIASWMLAVKTGLPFDPSEHTSYVKSWVKSIKDDSREIFRACADAQKILDFLLMGVDLGEASEKTC